MSDRKIFDMGATTCSARRHGKNRLLAQDLMENIKSLPAYQAPPNNLIMSEGTQEKLLKYLGGMKVEMDSRIPPGQIRVVNQMGVVVEFIEWKDNQMIKLEVSALDYFGEDTGDGEGRRG